MNELLKWGIENSESSREDPSHPTDPKAVHPPGTSINAEALRSLMGGPSDADLMKESLAAVLSPDVSLGNKLVAFDNFEQLIETIDNANNMESLGMWTPLVELLENEEGDLRMMAAWCLGTAVQNNVKAQQRLLVVGGVPKLVKLAMEDDNVAARKKSIYALSSEVRNCQPAMDEVMRFLPKGFTSAKVDAMDMNAVDGIMTKLREQIP